MSFRTAQPAKPAPPRSSNPCPGLCIVNPLGGTYSATTGGDAGAPGDYEALGGLAAAVEGWLCCAMCGISPLRLGAIEAAYSELRLSGQ